MRLSVFFIIIFVSTYCKVSTMNFCHSVTNLSALLNVLKSHTIFRLHCEIFVPPLSLKPLVDVKFTFFAYSCKETCYSPALQRWVD